MSNHPFWVAMTSIMRLRPVPDAKDGRTRSQRLAQGGVPYTSMWLDENDPRAPAPYAEMAVLKSLGFDDTVARSACLEILQRVLRFRMYQADVGSLARTCAVTTADGALHVEIHISAFTIWPLLVTRFYTEAERRSTLFQLASGILHELAHACSRIQTAMTSRMDLLRSTTIGPTLTPAIEESLLNLGDQIYGPLHYADNGNYRDQDNEKFFQDQAQSEEGIDFEKQLWGDRLLMIPYQAGSRYFTPITALSNWPAAHPQPLRVGFPSVKLRLRRKDTTMGFHTINLVYI